MVKLLLILGILFLNFCNETYIKFDPNIPVNQKLFKKGSSTVLYSYMINKESKLVQKDEMGIRNNYRVFIEDSKPFWDVYNDVVHKKNIIRSIDPKKIKNSKTVAQIPKREDEKYINLSFSPLYTEKVQRELIPKIAKELEVEQFILAKIDFDLENQPNEIDKSLLRVKLTVLVLNAKGEYIYASEKSKSILTYLPDDDISVANFLGDIFNATVKGNVFIKVNKHIRPQIYSLLGDLWNEIVSELDR
jgi:hypothetical protein